MMGREATGSGWQGVTEWALGIVGGIAAVLGLVILFVEEDQYVGIGGDLSWRVGDIPAAWSYGLLIGGGLLVVLALGMLLFGTPVPRAHPQNKARSELLWHVGIFVVVNAFLWLQDIVIGGGVDYAYWVTAPWGLGLAIHALVYYVGARRQQSTDLPPH